MYNPSWNKFKATLMDNSISENPSTSPYTEEDEFSSIIKLSPRVSSSTDEGYLRTVLLSRAIRSIFCASFLSRISRPSPSTNPFKPHIHLQNVKIKTKSLETIGGWVVHNKNKPIDKWALVLHGNSTNRNTFSRMYNIENMVEEGISALIIDYRGFGDSEGSPRKTAFMEDISASIKYFKQNHISTISIVAYSLGTAIALEYLAEYVKKTNKSVSIEKLVLVSPFTSTVSLLREYTIWNWIEKILPDSTESAIVGMGYNSVENIKNISIRTLVIHGGLDWLIPWHHGEILANSSQSATFLKIDKETHNSILKNPVTWKTIVRFIEQ